MIDQFDIPVDIGSNTGMADVQIFNRPSTVAFTQYQTWMKPRGKAMMNIICIGGGGGGGGGFTAVAAAARGGGGSGGSSAVSRVTIPLHLVPDVLFVQVGAGGAGGAAGATGGNGTLSRVDIKTGAAAVPSNCIAYSGAAAAVGGGGGTGAAAGAAGTAGTIGVIASMPLAGLGHFDLIAGQVGVAGGVQTGAVGVAQVIPVTSVITTGGSGGAGVTAADFAGGLWTAITDSWLSEQRPATPAAGSNNGSGGFAIWKPLFFFGGTGGSSSNAGVGGFGGNGSYGCGGGGGGGGTTGGSGGAGGSGLVIITCW